MDLNSDLVRAGLVLGACAALFKFSKNVIVRNAAVSVGAVVLVKHIPYAGSAL